MPGITDAVEVRAGTFGRYFIVCRRNGTTVGQLGSCVSGDFQLESTPFKRPPALEYSLGPPHR